MNISEICAAALSAGASDIHLKAEKPPMLRVDGILQPLQGGRPISSQALGKLAWDIMSAQKRIQFKTTMEADFALHVPEKGRFRVNVFRQRGHIGVVLRVVPDTPPQLSSLKLPKVLQELSSLNRGLVLLTGVTGSGKSTTLAAIIEEINRTRSTHIITIEDPIEFTFEDHCALINQREIGADSNSYPNALKSALRQDPDVILISEIRDRETMEIALTAAETGHLVLASLHSINAPEAITRIVDFFDLNHQSAIRHLLSGSLAAIVSQRLITAKAGGRVAAIEVMINRGAIRECITSQERTKEIPDFLASGTSQYGTQTFDQSLLWLAEDGLITKEEALKNATNTEDLELRFSGISSTDWNRP